MSKRNIAYVKPADPNFLRRLKDEIGYKEGPTVETKRQKVENSSDSDSEDVCRSSSAAAGAAAAAAAAKVSGEGRIFAGAAEDEKPQVVVLREGDLTAEEADAEKARIEKEEIEKPADLNKRVIFKSKHKPTKDSVINSDLTVKNRSQDQKDKKSKRSSKKEAKTFKLSFDQEDEEENF